MTSTVTITGTVFTTNRDGSPALTVKPSRAGRAYLTFDVADQHRRRDEAGNWQTDERKGHKGTSRYRVTVFDNAEEVKNLLEMVAGESHRCRVVVVGSVSVDTWQRLDESWGTTVSVVAARDGVGVCASPASRRQEPQGSWSAPAGGGDADPWGTEPRA